MGFARDVADRVVYMDQGLFIEEGSPSEVFSHPKDDHTRQFLRHILPEREPEHAAELGIAAGDQTPHGEPPAGEALDATGGVGTGSPPSEEPPLPGAAPQPPRTGTYLPDPQKGEDGDA